MAGGLPVDLTDDVCVCGHVWADHPDDDEPQCQVCDCEWFYAGREGW
jgi:hypothetical protein